MPDTLLARGSVQGRWVLAAAVLGSGMAMLDGTVVNIALRNVGEDLDAIDAGTAGGVSGAAGRRT